MGDWSDAHRQMLDTFSTLRESALKVVADVPGAGGQRLEALQSLRSATFEIERALVDAGGPLDKESIVHVAATSWGFIEALVELDVRLILPY
jgi:hypothetical protein